MNSNAEKKELVIKKGGEDVSLQFDLKIEFS